MAAAIAMSHAKCYIAFENFITAIHDLAYEKSAEYLVDVSEEFDKYKLWAGNVGAAHSGKLYKLSLDYRLREATFYKDQVLRLLAILHHHIEEGMRLATTDPAVCTELSSDSDSEFSDSYIAEESSDEDEELPTLPMEAGGQHETHLTEESPFLIPSNSLTDNGTSSDLQPIEADDYLAMLLRPLESIKLTVTCLYKFPIRRPAPVDRLNDKATDDTSCYQHFDVLYVKDKFPQLHEQVATRLGKLITRRRQLFLYRQSHQINLRTNSVVPSITMKTPERVSTNSGEAQSVRHKDLHESKTQSQPESSNRTKATTFAAPLVPVLLVDELVAPSVAESESKTSKAGSAFTRELHIEIPPRPRNKDGIGIAQFICKYCQTTPYIRSSRDWKKHVLADIQPYVCTFPDCDLSEHLFEDKDAWYNHETQFHRVKYSCNTDGHKPYTSQSDFGKHMKEDHDQALDRDNSLRMLDLFRRKLNSSGGLCNLCLRTTSNFKLHVSRHLEQIAMFALPRADYSTGDESANGGTKGSQSNARGSDVLDKQPTSSASHSTLSWNQGPEAYNSDIEFQNHTQETPEGLLPPNADETTWDIITPKFLDAREGHSTLAPINFPAIPLLPRQRRNAISLASGVSGPLPLEWEMFGRAP
ncbi:uncharacterized protein K452DRAFT_322128 [Aplosporella prunicola CBS 121167]|uniref:Oxidoreductase acuF-like C2H2 type zinc-finger domain-containing protein n=1 Tax=Aplosporella prunicola CBS 121167 TaxID=1176127 RepID=A0A6A6AY65_9PEZI|nr:uncharacterized protein K452DRAFT_322128 [Aplosporella prunicola CBS 121167]KAF2136882.1 hypothetical protein K452DRAFT_322128 [Aplosporella prunicola CBS 121167]